MADLNFDPSQFEFRAFDSIDDFIAWLEEADTDPTHHGLKDLRGRVAVFPFARHNCAECLLSLLVPPSELTVRDQSLVTQKRIADAEERRATAAETAVTIDREREDREKAL